MTTISRTEGGGFGWSAVLKAARGRDYLKCARLQSHPLLARCPSRVIRRLASIADEVVFAPGEILAEQGRSPEWFFLIVSGSAEVARDGSPLGLIGGGKCYGEVPLLGRGMHPATVRALTPMHAFAIGSQRFSPLVQDVRPIREELNASLARHPDLVAMARAELAKHLSTPRPTSLPARPWADPRGFRPRPRRALSPVTWGVVESRRSAGLRAVRAGAVAAILTVLAAGAALYHPPYGVIRPGPVIDVSHDIVISGARVHQPHGRYLLLTVRADRPSLFGLAMAAVHGGRPIERVDRTAPRTAAQRLRQLDEQFAQSQRDAAAAAAAVLGIHGSEPGRLPFTVEFRHRNVVGPSGGLIYALAIEDLLSGDDRASGRVIAATGEVNAAGDVEPVAYVNEKAIGARHAGAQLLLTPTSEAYEAVGAGVPVIGVSSIKEALSRLADS